MTWNDDLAELKKNLPAAPLAPPAVPSAMNQVSKKTKPSAPAPLVEEDQLFLAAMGLKAAPTTTASTNPAPQSLSLADEDQLFLESLPGTPRRKEVLPPPPSLQTEHLKKVLSSEKPLVEEVKELTPAPEPLQVAVSSSPQPASEIHLAAGMSVEVDAHLDLRHFTDIDGLLRLQERIEDGVFMGWRHLWVEFSSEGSLKATVCDNLKSGCYASIRQFAGAPERMGGTHALILYYLPSL